MLLLGHRRLATLVPRPPCPMAHRACPRRPLQFLRWQTPSLHRLTQLAAEPPPPQASSATWSLSVTFVGSVSRSLPPGMQVASGEDLVSGPRPHLSTPSSSERRTGSRKQLDGRGHQRHVGADRPDPCSVHSGVGSALKGSRGIWASLESSTFCPGLCVTAFPSGRPTAVSLGPGTAHLAVPSAWPTCTAQMGSQCAPGEQGRGE